MQPFYELDKFPEFAQLAAQYQKILNELKGSIFWMAWGSDNYDPLGHCKFLSGDWTVCPVYFGNYDPRVFKIPGTAKINVDEVIQALPTQFPETTKLLQNIKSVNFAALSRLHPKSSLAPHKHVNPNSLIFHLGLIIPQGNTCGLSVGGISHTWSKPGDAVIFNDTLEHSAWNNSDEERIILYLDFLRPQNP